MAERDDAAAGQRLPPGRLPVVSNPSDGRPSRPAIRLPRLPAAARPGVSDLYLLTLVSAIDGSLVLLGASGALSTLSGALAVGLTVVSGAGAWLAAQRAFGSRRRSRSDWRALLLLCVVTVAATVAAVALGARLGQAVALHVLPKAAGVALFLVALEVGGAKLPRPARVPLPVWTIAASTLLEVALRWTP